MSDCPLCTSPGGLEIHRDALLRVVRATDTPQHPAFYRVILNRHVSEMSQLPRPERLALMDAVHTVEAELLTALQPAKVNLASLGNVVPHLHWHVIARFRDDAQWPAPIWAPAARERDGAALQALQDALPKLDASLRTALATMAP